MQFNLTCNSTLEDLRITSEIPIAGDFTFHQLGFIIAGGSSIIAITLSLFLIWMHALHYTKPYEQRHIIRILFMVPIYAAASFLSFWFYWHAVYYQVISGCYEAFTIASFFALLCHYIAPNLHDQKNYFRSIQPRGWVWPLSWMRKCCCGDRGPWRTPRSGLTWFNIIWLGIYQYCFIKVAMTITSVVTQYMSKYCESSNSPVFAHIWVLVIEATAVAIAMYCVVQFYVQLRDDLRPHAPLIKVTSIKLVIFLSFWQTFMISILTSTFDVLQATQYVAYPDIKVGIPSILLCVEMAIFAVIHIFAYPYKPYINGRESSKYPSSNDPGHPKFNDLGPNQGGFLGISAFIDAMNIWDLVKAFGRGVRWIFVGRREREKDTSYNMNMHSHPPPLDTASDSSYKGNVGTVNLPIAEQFRRSKFGMPTEEGEEGAGLIAHAQPEPYHRISSGRYTPARERYDPHTGQELSSGGRPYDPQSRPYEASPSSLNQMYSSEPPASQIGIAQSTYDDHSSQVPVIRNWTPPHEVQREVRAQRPHVVKAEMSPPQAATVAAHQALWERESQPNTPTTASSGAGYPGRERDLGQSSGGGSYREGGRHGGEI